jgi:hypothetical protein
MVIEALVKDQVVAGRTLLRSLQSEGFSIVGALWYRHEQVGYWELCIFSDLVKEKGPLEAYGRLRKIWDKVAPPEISFTDVALLHPDDPLYAWMRLHAARHTSPSDRSHDVAYNDAFIYDL